MNSVFIRKKIENILYKSSVDKTFRKECLRDGKPILEKELNIKLDADVTVSFKENNGKVKDVKLTGKDLLFILPEYVGNVNKLNRDDLEKITGGISTYMHINADAIHAMHSLLKFNI